MLVCDTGPLVAAALYTDIHHHECVELFTGMHLASRDLVLPAPVIAEVGYFLAREASADVESSFLRSLADGAFKPIELVNADYTRMANLVDQYADLPLGTTDAAVIAPAERLEVKEIATIDRRHFNVVRPRHTKAFTILPLSTRSCGTVVGPSACAYPVCRVFDCATGTQVGISGTSVAQFLAKTVAKDRLKAPPRSLRRSPPSNP